MSKLAKFNSAAGQAVDALESKTNEIKDAAVKIVRAPVEIADRIHKIYKLFQFIKGFSHFLSDIEKDD